MEVILIIVFGILILLLTILILFFLLFTHKHTWPYIRLAHHGDIILGSTMKYISIPMTQVRLDHEEQDYHATIWGSTGSGKSFLLLNIFVQNFLKGNCVGMIDPHNNLSLDTLRQLIHHGAFKNQEAYKRLVYIDWGSGLITPFNVLEGADDDQYDTELLNLKPSSATGKVLDMAYRVWPELEGTAPAFKQYFRSAMLVLIHNKLPLAYIHDFLTDQDFRKACLQSVTDPRTLHTWEAVDNMKEADRQSLIGSASRRADDIINNPIMDFAFRSPDNLINHRKWMDEGTCFIHNIGKVKVKDPAAAHILGALLLVDIEHALTSRVDLLPGEKRPDCTVLVDEWQLFADQEATITHTLSETRKYGGRLYLATQHTGAVGSARMQGAVGQAHLNIVMRVDEATGQSQAPQIAHYDLHQVKEAAATDTQHNLFAGLLEQTREWVDSLKDMKKQWAYVKITAQHVKKIKTFTVPKPKVTQQELDDVITKYRALYQRTVPEAQAKLDEVVKPTLNVNAPYKVLFDTKEVS